MNSKAGEAPRVDQSSIAPTSNPSGVTNVGNAVTLPAGIFEVVDAESTLDVCFESLYD